ncbi:M14 family metallopeptidase [Neobacillus soli]|uniref:M14 family metallopeptidase n=1 Tax=Neobacillus soli TaxID=220688 RepID=UPI0008249243|nr:M14 family metallopeptidase [Neobacillus soli]
MKRILVTLLSMILLFSIVTHALAGNNKDEPKPAAAPSLEVGEIVRILVPGSDVLDTLQNKGYDLAGGVKRVPDGIEVDAILTKEQLKALPEYGIILADDPLRGAPEKALRSLTAKLANDKVTIGRVDWFTSHGQGFLSVEAKTTAEDGAVLTLHWGDKSQKMELYMDSGVYMYHRVLAKVDGPRPDTIKVTSSIGAESSAKVNDWLYPIEADIDRPGYKSGFADGYQNPTQLYKRIEQLAAEHPEITEIIELPNKTNGYRRHAQAQFGNGTSGATGDLHSTFYVSSKKYGHEGGNDITVTLDRQIVGNETSVSVNANNITVHLAVNKNDPSKIAATAKEVVAAINEDPEANALVTADLYRNGNGSGIAKVFGATKLTDFLKGPKEISREPFTMKALRIGKKRDGTKPGVMIQAQDHAREWVTPLVALESAERLLANYETDEKTKEIVDNVDIFIIPSNNPDGAHYTFFDSNMQRRNMTNHCGPENADPGRRNSWGVDLNRNYSVGSVYDGYSGGSTVCTSDTYAGPSKLSEPEAQNAVWLAENYSNIKFFMTVHSYGGQLFWQPGSYKADGRITTPRPPLRDEQYYWQMAEKILSNVKSLRDSVVQPSNIGGSADVLYSSAGNVREELYNNYGIYAFGWEVGGEQWDPKAQRWLAPGGFQPAWAEGSLQYQEYASGVITMFELAMEYGRDNKPATTEIIQDKKPDGSVNITFSQSKPASIHYTTDGSTPTVDSPTYEAANIREPGETIKIYENTTFRWISVDVKGNNEKEQNVDVKVEISAANMKKLVENFLNDGDITNNEAARSLTNHLTALSLYEEKGLGEKVQKHLNGFKVLLDNHYSNNFISKKAFNILQAHADYLINQWK